MVRLCRVPTAGIPVEARCPPRLFVGASTARLIMRGSVNWNGRRAISDPLWDLVEPVWPTPRIGRKAGGRACPIACLTGTRRKPSRWLMRFPTARRPRTTAAGARLRARGSLRLRGDSARSSDSAHRGHTGHAPHHAWEWPVPVAVGRGEPLRGSVSFAACGCGMTSGPTSTRPSFRSGAR